MTRQTGPGYTVATLDAHDVDAVADTYVRSWAGEPAPPLDIRTRCEWFYLANPAGAARILRLQSTAGEPVGMLALVPRTFWFAGRPATMGLLCDFIVHRDHRTVMPALKLQRAARELATQLGWGTYAIPNERSLPLLRRLGGHVQFDRPRLVRVMRHKSYIEPKSRALAWAGSGALDIAYRAWDYAHARRADELEASWTHGFDGRFDDLWQRMRRTASMGERSAEFLAWRFGREPGRANETIAVKDARTGRLVAYAVGQPTDSTFEIRDFASDVSPERLTPCLAAIVRRLRSTPVRSITCRLSADAATTTAFYRLGFRPRESESVFIYACPGSQASPSQLTRADEDV